MLAQQTISHYLQHLAGKFSTPGGGAAAGISGAQAAALLAMVAEFSKDQVTLMAAIIATCETSRNHYLDLAEQDIQGFNAVMAAYGLSATDAAAKQHKQQALQAALQTAAAAPMAMIRAALALLPVAQQLRDTGNKNLITDVGIAASLLLSCLQSSRLNLLVNLRSIKDPAFIRAGQHLLASSEEGLAAFGDMVSAVEARL